MIYHINNGIGFMYILPRTTPIGKIEEILYTYNKKQIQLLQETKITKGRYAKQDQFDAKEDYTGFIILFIKLIKLILD